VAAIQRQALRRKRIKRGLTMAGLLVVAGLFAAGSIALILISTAKAQAEENATVARRAQLEAQNRLQERIRAEEERKRAVARTGVLQGQVEMSATELKKAYVELQEALLHTQEQKAIAEKAKGVAESKEQQAKDAQANAEKLAEELRLLLERERDRANRLNQQIGSIVESLD
jgi:hypothetical protein